MFSLFVFLLKLLHNSPKAKSTKKTMKNSWQLHADNQILEGDTNPELYIVKSTKKTMETLGSCMLTPGP